MIANLPQLCINTEGAKISFLPYTEAAGCPSALHGTSSALQGLSLEGRMLPWCRYWATRQEESWVVGPGDGRSCRSSPADLCCMLVSGVGAGAQRAARLTLSREISLLRWRNTSPRQVLVLGAWCVLACFRAQ